MREDSDFEALTDELYARPPAGFVTRRDELATQARTAGDRVLATQIKALRRPSVGAWYLNSGVRARLASLEELILLGQQLRDAQSRGDFDAVRELGAQRGAAAGATLRELRAHLAGAGITATATGLEEVRATLTSALADPDVADQLARGRLDRPHVYAGLGDLPDAVGADGRGAGRPRPGRSPDPTEQDRAADDAEHRAAEEAAARQELERAEAELAARTAERDAADTEVRARRERVAALTAELDEARATLRAATKELDAAVDRQAVARRRAEHARRQAGERPS